MRAVHRILVIALAGLTAVISTGDASAHLVRRHRLAHHFVFATPQTAAVPNAIGFVGGYFGTGLLGASSADPYDNPAYGYDLHGRYGLGSGYFEY